MSLFMVGAVGAGLSSLGLLRIAYAWAFPPEKPALRFSEAEIAFLFPAPVTRRTLLHFRLLSSQVAILLSAVLMAIVLRPLGGAGGSRLLRSFGWWIILSTFDLHLNGTNLAVARLRERTRHPAVWRGCVAGALVAYGVAVAWIAARVVDAAPDTAGFTPSGIADLTGQIEASSALRWITIPFRIVFGPYLAQTPSAFASALVPALLFLGVHYLWVIGSETRFEEGSLALAEKRAQARAAALEGGGNTVSGGTVKAHPGPFPLAEKGPPEVAFLWKNLLSMRSGLFGRRALVLMLGIALLFASAAGPAFAGRGGSSALGPLVLTFSILIAGYTVVLGPQLARQDLRSDFPSMDILKTYPIEGWRLALGELLAPAAILTTILWLAIITAAASLRPEESPGWLTHPVKVAAALCLGSAAPFLCLTQLVVPNLLMVLMPGWYQSTRTRGAGVDLFGQRLIFGIVQLLFAALAVVPSAGAAALVIFSSQWVLGIIPALLLATSFVLPILATEAAVGLWWIGERIENLDLSSEPR
jgi:hypothetical protein